MNVAPEIGKVYRLRPIGDHLDGRLCLILSVDHYTQWVRFSCLDDGSEHQETFGEFQEISPIERLAMEAE